MAQMEALIAIMKNLLWGMRGPLCPVVSAISFKRRTNTSPSISANDKTLEWSSGAGERVATGAPHQEACAQLSGMHPEQEAGARTRLCRRADACFKIQLQGIEELEWFNWFSKWPVFRDEWG